MNESGGYVYLLMRKKILFFGLGGYCKVVMVVVFSNTVGKGMLLDSAIVDKGTVLVLVFCFFEGVWTFRNFHRWCTSWWMLNDILFSFVLGALTELREALSHPAADAEKFRYRRARTCKHLSRNLSYKH